jgi:hypothetical protein
MKPISTCLWAVIFALCLSVRAADTNSPLRLTVELRDGSRVVGASVGKNINFHSALLGDLKFAVKDIRSVDCATTNTAKLTTVNGDVLTVSFSEAGITIKTSFGNIELAPNSLRKLSVAGGGVPVPTREGLIGFWSGNDNAKDSEAGNHGTLVGAANFAPGPTGLTFNFDSPGSYVKIPKSPALDPGSAVTVEFWMKADANNAMSSYQGLVVSDFYGVEISNGYGGTMGVNFFANLDGSRIIRLPGFPPGSDMADFAGATTVENFTHVSDANGGGARVSAGEWHHVAATYDGMQMRIYIDGQPWGRPNVRRGSIAPMLPESFVCIGSEDGRMTCPECAGNRYFKGQIGNVAIYRRALTAAEIREDFETQKIQ